MYNMGEERYETNYSLAPELLNKLLSFICKLSMSIIIKQCIANIYVNV